MQKGARRVRPQSHGMRRPHDSYVTIFQAGRAQSPAWRPLAPARVSPLDENFPIDDRAVLKITERLKRIMISTDWFISAFNDKFKVINRRNIGLTDFRGFDSMENGFDHVKM